MEITNEIKVKMFAQYLGQKIMLDKHDIWTGFYCEGAILKHLEKEAIGEPKLILKPLFTITDFQLLQIAKLYESTASKAKINFNTGELNFNFFVSETVKQGAVIYINDSRKAYQYLIENGFDTKQILLGGKTLQEAGLAIYE